MPNVVIPLPNVDESVSKSVISDLTEQVLDLINLKHVQDVRYINYSGSVQNPDGAIGIDSSRYPTFSGKTRIFVEAEETYNEDGWSSTVVERIDNVPIFADPKLNVWVTPVHVPSDLTLKIKFQTRSRDEASRWQNDMVTRLAQLREGKQHRINFNINLPFQVWELLESIFNNREAFAGYGETFESYVKKHSDGDLTLVTAADGKLPFPAIRRILNRVNGRFMVSPLPEKPTFDESGGVWECTVDYKVTYDRPISCVVRYPIQVHQKFLPSKFILPGTSSPNPVDSPKKLGQAQLGLGQFEGYTIYGYHAHQDAYMRIPKFDDYVFKIVPKGTATVFLGLTEITHSDPHVLLNLGDLGDVVIDEDILQFIREVEYPYLNQPYKSFFGLNYYRNDDLVLSSDIACDANLNVSNTEPISVRANNRIRFFIVVDPTLLPLEAFERLYNYPKVIAKLVKAINDALRYNVDFTATIHNKFLYEWQFTKLWHLLNGLRPNPDVSYGNNNWIDKNKPLIIEGPGGFGWDGDKWVGVGSDDGRSSHTRENKDKPIGIKHSGSMFGIPNWAWKSLNKTAKMRTVQISHIAAYRK